jgi:hypothetical protein
MNGPEARDRESANAREQTERSTECAANSCACNCALWYLRAVFVCEVFGALSWSFAVCRRDS